VSGGEHELADAHEESSSGDETPRPDPVQEDSHRDLKRGIDCKLQNGEQREHGRRRRETSLRLDSRNPQRRALKDRDGIRREPQRVDQPSPSWRPFSIHRP
jgi:hypothetical protein